MNIMLVPMLTMRLMESSKSRTNTPNDYLFNVIVICWQYWVRCGFQKEKYDWPESFSALLTHRCTVGILICVCSSLMRQKIMLSER